MSVTTETKQTPVELLEMLRSAISEHHEQVRPLVEALPWMGGQGEIRGSEAGITMLLDMLGDALGQETDWTRARV